MGSRLDKRIAVVTGGSADTEAAVRAAGGRFLGVTCDCSKPGQVQAFADQVRH